MARSIVYKRSLDIKVLPSSGNSNHEFQFIKLVKIKKEGGNESLDMESGITSGAPVTNSSGLHDDHDPELHSVNTSVQLHESNDAAHPKLVIKFRDLWKKSDQSGDSTQKRKRSEDRESENEIITVHKLKVNKTPELSISSEDCISRSSLSTPRPSECNQETKSTSDCLQQKSASDNKEKKVVPRFGRLKKKVNTSCESCGMRFETYGKLQAHKRYYSPDGEFYCPTCNVGFSRNYQLTRHMKVIHSTSKTIEDIYKFKCNFCVNRFEKKSSLVKHIVHLHSKHVVSNKKSTNVNRVRGSSSNSAARRKKTNGFVRKSQRIRNSNSEKTTLDGDSGLIKNSSGSVGNLCDTNEHLINKDLGVQQNRPTVSQFTGDNMDSENKKANTNSNRDPINTDHSKRRRIVMILDKSNVEGTAQLQQIQYSIKNSTQKPIKPRDVKKTIDNAALRLRKELSETNARILQESNRKRSQTQRWSRTGTEISPANVHPQQMGNLRDHLGNIVGTWCTTQPYDQPHKQDYVAGSSSASTTAVLGIPDVLQCTRSSIPKPTILNSSIPKIMDTVSCPDPKLTPDEDSSFQEKSMNVTENGNGVNERLKVTTPHGESDKQVGSVHSHQALEDHETARSNVDAEDAAIKCDDSDIHSIQIDDFGETAVKIEDEEMSDDSCKLISREMTASSSNISLTDSLSSKFDHVTTLKNCNIRNYPGIKDVRVLLVKLENMLNVSMKNSTPESSLLDNNSLVKTETPHCDPCEEQSTSNLALRQYSTKKHDSRVADPEKNSGPISRKNRDTTNNFRKVISKKNGLRGLWKSGRPKATEKRCHLCDEVFQQTFLSASHYLSVHTEAGALECCVCSAKCKNLRKLRIHLCTHYSETPGSILCKSCVVCKKKLSTSSLSQRCTNCDENSNAKQGKEERIERVQNVKGSIEHAHTQVTEKIDVSEHRSLSKTSSVSMSKKEAKSNTLLVDHESAKNDKKVLSSVSCGEVVKNFNCSVCKRAFSKSSQLRHHLSVAHTDVKYRKSKRYQNSFKPPTSSYSTSRDCKRGSRKRDKNKNNLEKFNVGKKKYFKSKGTRIHDKFCKKKSHERRRLKFFKINSTSQHFIRQHHIHGNAKIYYKYKCDVCGLKCCCRRNLEIHKKCYSTNGKNACNICGLKFAWKQVLAMHMKTAHNQKTSFRGRLRCEVCNQGFRNKKFLRIHLAHFHNLQYFQCTICRIRFDTPRSLNNHRRYYSKNRRTLCGICGQSLKCKYMLQYHKAQVHDREKLEAWKYFCRVCDCAFIDKLLLQAHIGHFHNIQDREIETNSIDEDVSTVTRRVSENIELPVRTDFVCNDSNVSTNTSTIRIDVIEADHAQKTSEEAVMVDEIIRTSTSSQYKCDICKLSFTDPYAILNHEWDYSNEGTFTCNVCNRRFMTYSLLKNHKIKHFQRNVVCNYECYICKEDFSRADHLNAHGLHLHGPEFVLVKDPGTDDILDNDMSESEINSNRDSVPKKFSVDHARELVAGYHKTCQIGKILLFRKIGNNKSTELARRNSNEDAYCCYFCQTSFTAAFLLRSHIRKHDYRPYYHNSSRYLCLICKDKFRTNDLLRAHVVHCHTTDLQEQNLSGSEESETDSSDIRSGVNKNDNITQRVAENFTAKDAIQNPTSTSVIVESDYSEIILDVGFDSTPEEVKLFTAKVEDVEGLQKYMCTVCIVTFNSVAQFREHFTSTHVKNGKYLCTFCGEQFPLMVDLKDHTFKHENESKKYVCCDEKFLLVTDFVRHQSSHDGQTEDELDEPTTQLPPSVESGGGSLKEVGNGSNADKIVNPCKCELCGKTVLDFEAMLKHWDSCIDANGLQCDLCRATFKSLTSFRMHMSTYHKGKPDVNPIKNRRSPRVISDKIIPASMQSSIMHGKKPRTIKKSINVNARKKLERAVALTSELPKKNELLKFGSITVKSIAKEIKNSKNNNEGHDNEHRETNATRPRLEFTPDQDVQLPTPSSVLKRSLKMISNENLDNKIHWERKDNTSTPVSNFPQLMNSSTHGPQADKEVSNDIPRNANENRSLYHLPVQGVNNISKVHVGSNDSGLRLQQSKCQEPKLARSHTIPSSSVNDLSSVPSTTVRSINIDNTRVASSDSGEKPRSNDCQSQQPLNFIPASLNAPDSAAYFLCIQPTADCTNGMNNAMVSPSDSSHTIQLNDSNSKLLPSLLPFSMNVGPSPAYFLCLKPVSNDPTKCIIQTAPLNDPKLKSQPNRSIGRRLPPLLSKPPVLVPNPLHDSDVPRKAVHSKRKNKRNVVPHDSTSRKRSTSNKALKAPKFTPGPSTSTSGNLPQSKKKVTEIRSIYTSASSKELAPKIEIVRCRYCNLLFTEKAKLIQHEETHKTNNQCPACGLTFSNEDALQLHLPEHKSSTCTRCNMIAFFSDSLARPRGAEKYCSACNTLLPLPKRRHNRSAKNPPHQVMKCGICMDTFETMSQMTAHFKMFHSVFVCGTCKRRFNTRISILSHMRTHGSKNPDSFQCETCKIYFIDEIDLEEHLLSH